MKTCPQCRRTYADDAGSCRYDGAVLVAPRLPRQRQMVGSYRLIEEIGRGGMGTVYRALHVMLNEERALKIINPDGARDPEFLDRFKAEAAITRQLRHPNIVRVEDAGQTDDGLPFLAMEYVRGQSLAAVIQKQGALPPIRALNICVQVCAALMLAHERGIIHRDIKPDNILSSGTGDDESIKVVDFGIAKVREGASLKAAGSHTRVGVFMGAPIYCSPEQAAGKRGFELDGRSDLYSLGIVLYELVTGKPPFSADSPMGMLVQHIQTTPERPSTQRPDLNIPDCIDTIVMKALQKEVAARFQSAAEMQTALQEAMDLVQSQRLTAVAGADAVGGTPVRKYLTVMPSRTKTDEGSYPHGTMRAELGITRKTLTIKNRIEAIEIGILNRTPYAWQLHHKRNLVLLCCLWLQMAGSVIAAALPLMSETWSRRLWLVQIVALMPITAFAFMEWFYRARKNAPTSSIAPFVLPGITFSMYVLGGLSGLASQRTGIQLGAAIAGIVSAGLAVRLVWTKKVNQDHSDQFLF